jgi:multisubunit Na+/H+ antiporter MnhG subunit
VRTAIEDLLLVGGVAAELLAVAGVVIARDATTRLHFASAATTVPPLLIAGAVVVNATAWTTTGVSAILVAAFLLFFGPVVMHGTARAARMRMTGSVEPTAAEQRRGSA